MVGMMQRHFRLGVARLAWLALLCTPCFADVSVRQLSLGQTDTDVHVRVIVVNPSASMQNGPLKVTLYVRPNARGHWKIARIWKDVGPLQPSAFVVKEEYSGANAVLARMTGQVNWEAHVTVEIAGAQVAEKYEGFYDTAEH